MPDTGFQPTNVVLNIISANLIVPDNGTMKIPDWIEVVDTYGIEIGASGNIEVVVLI